MELGLRCGRQVDNILKFKQDVRGPKHGIISGDSKPTIVPLCNHVNTFLPKLGCSQSSNQTRPGVGNFKTIVSHRRERTQNDAKAVGSTTLAYVYERVLMGAKLRACTH